VEQLVRGALLRCTRESPIASLAPHSKHAPHDLPAQSAHRTGHNAVAHHLIDSALEAMHRFDHPLKHRVEELASFLGVAVGE
jgi:hypothetical protein